MPKEQLDVFGNGRSAVLHNFNRISTFSDKGKSTKKTPGKGYDEEIEAFLDAVVHGRQAISVTSQLSTTLTTLKILDSLTYGTVETVDIGELTGEPS